MQVVDASIETESEHSTPALDIELDVSAAESVPKSKSKKVKAATEELGSVGHPHSDASKARISAANKGKVPWNVGKKHSEETKMRIAEKTKEAMLKRRIATALELGFSSLEEHVEQKKQDKIRLKIEKDKTKVKGLTAEGRKKISDRFVQYVLSMHQLNIVLLVSTFVPVLNFRTYAPHNLMNVIGSKCVSVTS